MKSLLLGSVVVSLIASCGGSDAPADAMRPTPSGGSTGSTSTGGGSGHGGAGGTSVSDGAKGGTTGGAAGGSNLSPNEIPATGTAPGRYVMDASTAGTGPCAGVALSTVLAAIRTTDESLASVTSIYNPTTTVSGGDGSFIYPYARTDGGFDVVFKVGSGDCESGCTDNAYTYFATDDACHAQNVGHYHATWGSGTCLSVDGAAMWNHPPAPDPATVCGQDNAARDLRGTYVLHASGTRTACSTTDAKGATIDAAISVLVEQDAKNLATGFVTFTGTGYALVDGVRLPAQFLRKRFDAALQSSNLPNACPRTQSVTSSYDFEGYQPGSIEVTETGNDACAACKGGMSVTLTPTTATAAP
ncbi:MAG TPA: hypothetical protein VHJ20_19195 [Polyangia bacterium]|nr:hypothetical protein [Polyangia bacterium]